MKIRAVTLRWSAPGVGVAVECAHRLGRLEEAFDRYLPLTSSWRDAFRAIGDRRGVTAQPPPDHDGWELAGRKTEPDEVIVYLGAAALADAFNHGTLAPLGGVQALDRWGLRARNRVSRSRLEKRRALLRAMGLYSIHDLSRARLDGPVEGARPLDVAGETDGVYLPRAVGLGWSGMVRTVAAPLVVGYGHGVTVRRAIWVADFPRPRKFARRHPLPYLYFDGANLRVVDTLDDVERADRFALESGGTARLVSEVSLVPPWTFKARYVFTPPMEEESSDPWSEDDDDDEPSVDATMPWLDALWPVVAHASVDVHRAIVRLGEDEARVAWDRFGLELREIAGPGPPDRDYLLCDRGPSLLATVAATDRAQQLVWQEESV
jgi:hypothetical protein